MPGSHWSWLIWRSVSKSQTTSQSKELIGGNFATDFLFLAHLSRRLLEIIVRKLNRCSLATVLDGFACN